MKNRLWMAAALALFTLAYIGFPCALLCTPAHAEDAKPLHPHWTGPVTGTLFTGAGPDSIEGAKAKIHVPIGVPLTKPFSKWGLQFTPEAQFEWTTKAYLGEDSDPLRDASYKWWPLVRIVPETPGALQWVKTGPEHESNGDVDPQSRSRNQWSAEAAFNWQVAGIDLWVYAKGWVVYDYGENTETIGDAINLINDFGGQVIVRGSISVLDLATELGPEWQKVMAYVPLNDFYNFGLYGELHHGKYEGQLEYNTDVTSISGGVAFKPY